MQENIKNEDLQAKDEKIERIRDILLGSGLVEIQQQIEEIKNQLTDTSAAVSKDVEAVNSSLRSIITKVAVKLNDAIDEIEQRQITFEEEAERKIGIQDSLIQELQIQIQALTLDSQSQLQKAIKDLKKEYQKEILELKQSTINKSKLVDLLTDISINISEGNSQKK